MDSDGDGNINARDTNSNNDSYTDDRQVWVVFRTNATDGNYVGAGKWIALIAKESNPDTRTDNDYAASNALYTFSGEIGSPPGAAQIQNPYGPPPASDVAPLETPEGYAVLWAQNGSTYDIFIDLPGSTYAKYIKNGSPPSDYTTSNRNVSSFLANKQETYDGRAALNPDTDFDGINNTRETECGLNNTNSDTDGDGISDGKEYRGCGKSDGDNTPDANDTDSDNDTIPDALEDVNFNGRWDAGETDATFNDTDRDGILDGAEDADHDGIKDASETSPIDKDTDDDGIADKAELDGTWCYIGESVSACAAADHNVRKTGPLDTDSDDDGLLDGQEIGMASAGVETLVSAFKGDADPSTTTNPNVTDTDSDGISDRYEDIDLDGRVDSGEPNPAAWDTDKDGLCDGNCSGVGEDKNLNGIRDQDADGNYLETDFLANDSDVDGIPDSAETNGTWSYASGVAGCPGGDKTPCKLDPLNPDFDGDGLRDGQETAGWMVGIWRESTMEKVTNYTVSGDPADPTSDGDALTDFEEFMNGSDPRALDTDKDGIDDAAEIERKSNITGVEGSPPRIENVTLNTEVITVVGWLYLSITAKVTLTFDVIDNVGIDYVDINMTRYVGSDVRRVAFSTNPANYTWSSHITEIYEFSIVEVLVAGAYLNITAYDVNGNGAWGDFHIKSVVETVVDLVIAIFLAPIAKMIVEAASAAIDWIWGALEGLLKAVTDALDAVIRAIVALVRYIFDLLWDVAVALQNAGIAFEDAGELIFGMIFGDDAFGALELIDFVMTAIDILTLPWVGVFGFLLALLIPFVMDVLVPASSDGSADSLGSLFMALASGNIAGAISSGMLLYGEQLFAPLAPGRGDEAVYKLALGVVAIISGIFGVYKAWKSREHTATIVKEIHLDKAKRGLITWQKFLSRKTVDLLIRFGSLLFSALAIALTVASLSAQSPMTQWFAGLLNILSMILYYARYKSPAGVHAGGPLPDKPLKKQGFKADLNAGGTKFWVDFALTWIIGPINLASILSSWWCNWNDCSPPPQTLPTKDYCAETASGKPSDPPTAPARPNFWC